MSENRSIHFVDSNNRELFQIPDGGFIVRLCGNGDSDYGICHYLDADHMDIDGQRFSLLEFAEKMERNGISYFPA
ncbi:MAG: hypothetical protein Q4C40_01580 [Eubacteriales bacterium]|nr:hypothetical protein [Eubacteriales bacterium]